jgi:hypothetical protein
MRLSNASNSNRRSNKTSKRSDDTKNTHDASNRHSKNNAVASRDNLRTVAVAAINASSRS